MFAYPSPQPSPTRGEGALRLCPGHLSLTIRLRQVGVGDVRLRAEQRLAAVDGGSEGFHGLVHVAHWRLLQWLGFYR